MVRPCFINLPNFIKPLTENKIAHFTARSFLDVGLQDGK